MSEITFDDIPPSSPISYGDPPERSSPVSSDGYHSSNISKDDDIPLSDEEEEKEENSPRSYESETNVVERLGLSEKELSSGQPSLPLPKENLDYLLSSQRKEIIASVPEMKKSIEKSIRRDISSAERKVSSRKNPVPRRTTKKEEVEMTEESIQLEKDPLLRFEKMKAFNSSIIEKSEKEKFFRSRDLNRDETLLLFRRLIEEEKIFEEEERDIFAKMINQKFWTGCKYAPLVEEKISNHLKNTTLITFFK